MKLDNRKNILKEILSAKKLTLQQRKEFIELPEVEAVLKQQWERASQSPADELLKKQIWNQIENKRKNKKSGFIAFKPKWQMIAASIALFISTIGWWIYTQTGLTVNNFIEVTAQEAQLYILPDSSKVWLKQGSAIKYAKAFEKDRRVWLSGNSLFEVTKRNGNPFQVYINKAMIEVKGTSFEIHQNEELQKNEVILYSGKVNFTAMDKEIAMQPFEKIIHDIKKEEIRKEQIENINYKNGSFQFTELPLDKLIETINNMYNSNVRLEAVNLDKQPAFTGKIRIKETLDDVLKKICFSLSLSMKERNNEIIIYK